jgi:hypothetical protein
VWHNKRLTAMESSNSDSLEFRMLPFLTVNALCCTMKYTRICDNTQFHSKHKV